MALYNLKNPAVKRLMREAAELKSPTEEYFAQPLEDNLFEWHFTLRGPPNTEFEGGIYHGRITLPPEYPMKPPSIILLTPNGRFEINKKICLSISGHHPETWQPSWSIRTALLAIIGFMPTHGNGAIGSLDYTPEERKHLAIKSQSWECSDCGLVKNVLKVDNAKIEPNQNDLCNSTSFNDGDSLLAQNQNDVTCKESFQTCDLISSNLACDTGSTNSQKIETDSVPRLRYLCSQQNKDSLSASNIIPKSADSKSTSDYCSLLCIWIIVLVLLILICRRLFYQ